MANTFQNSHSGIQVSGTLDGQGNLAFTDARGAQVLSATVLAVEFVDVTQRIADATTIKNAIALFSAGTGTTAQMQTALAKIIQVLVNNGLV